MFGFLVVGESTCQTLALSFGNKNSDTSSDAITSSSLAPKTWTIHGLVYIGLWKMMHTWTHQASPTWAWIPDTLSTVIKDVYICHTYHTEFPGQ